MAARVLLLTTNDLHTYGSVDGQPATLSGARLLARLPAPPDVPVTVEEVMTGPSWDMPPSGMLALARRVKDAIIEDRGPWRFSRTAPVGWARPGRKRWVDGSDEHGTRPDPEAGSESLRDPLLFAALSGNEEGG